MYTNIPIDPRPEDQNNEKIIRNINDIRILNFFSYYINSKLIKQPFSNLLINEKSALKNELINYFLLAYPNPSSRHEAITDILRKAEKNIIATTEFDWLKENENACCTIWGYLASTPKNELPISHENESLLNSNPYAIFYYQLDLNETPVSHMERFECLKAYFDKWMLPLNEKSNKSDFMHSLKDRWISMLNQFNTFTWLTKPEREQCEWAWRYLNDYHRKENTEGNDGIKTISIFKPINEHEKFLAIYAALYLWKPHRAEKTLFIKNINRAWRERQRRREQENKKTINSYVDIKVKEKLDLLARYNRCKINEVLSDLINKEYKLHENDIKEKLNIS